MNRLSSDGPSVMLAPVKRQNIYEQVIAHLKDYIVANQLRPGDRLPTEAILAERLGVSRLTVREALKVMESLGVAQSRPGDGTRLREFTVKPLVDHLRFMLDWDATAFAELVDARRILEDAFIPVIVERATEADLDRIARANDRMEALMQAGDLGIDADMEFHASLAAATRNRALEGFSSMLQEFFRQVRARGLSTPEDCARAVEEHRRIHDALRRRDIEAARACLRVHLKWYERHSPSPPSPGAT